MSTPKHLRRRVNPIPTWTWAAPVVLVVAIVAGAQIRRALAKRRETGPIYLYWAELMPTAFQGKFPGYVPHIQREDGTEHVTLDGTLAENQALVAALAEIERRGGVARAGRPV